MGLPKFKGETQVKKALIGSIRALYA